MPSTLTPVGPLCGLRYTDRSLLELHIREDHAQRGSHAERDHDDSGDAQVSPVLVRDRVAQEDPDSELLPRPDRRDHRIDAAVTPLTLGMGHDDPVPGDPHSAVWPRGAVRRDTFRRPYAAHPGRKTVCAISLSPPVRDLRVASRPRTASAAGDQDPKPGMLGLVTVR